MAEALTPQFERYELGIAPSAALAAASKAASGDGTPPQSKEEAQAKAIADAVKLIFKKAK